MRGRDLKKIRRQQRGYALLALLVALIVMAISMTVVIPNAGLQARRELEIEMMFRGEQMAEAIARYYSQGRLTPAGVVVKSPPPPYGYLTELKKLRDGVTMGVTEVFLARKSAFIDPLTGLEWEPVRIGDPRLRRYFRQWQQATGRQLPPIYASYLPRGNVINTDPNPSDSSGADDGGKPSTGTPQTPPDGEEPDEDDEDFDDEDEDDEDEDDEDEDFDDEEDEGDGGGMSSRYPEASVFINAAYQVTQNDGPSPRPQRGPRQPAFSFNGGNAPIIGVVSKAKGKSVKVRFGIEKYEEMIFIYIPQTPPLVVGQPGQPGQPGQNGEQNGPINDRNGDGIDDSLTPQNSNK